MGEAASERKATADEIATMQNLVREAMRAGAAGFTSSHAPTHVDPDGRPVPSRHADFDEVLALASAAGEGGAGSIGFLARTAVQGYDAEDRARVVKLAHASGLPVVVQLTTIVPSHDAVYVKLDGSPRLVIVKWCVFPLLGGVMGSGFVVVTVTATEPGVLGAVK